MCSVELDLKNIHIISTQNKMTSEHKQKQQQKHNSTETAMLILDIDGYQDETKTIRPRELGYAVMTGEHVHYSGSVYFYDSMEMAPIAMEQAWFVYRNMHGLPLNPKCPEDYNKIGISKDSTIHCSSQLEQVIRDKCQEAVKKTGAKQLFVLHKGGEEGKQAMDVFPHCIPIDLTSLKCKRVDRLATLRPDWVKDSGQPCPCHVKIRPNKHFAIVHCPRLEVLIFAHWIRSVCVRGENPFEETKLVNKKKSQPLHGWFSWEQATKDPKTLMWRYHVHGHYVPITMMTQTFLEGAECMKHWKDKIYFGSIYDDRLARQSDFKSEQEQADVRTRIQRYGYNWKRFCERPRKISVDAWLCAMNEWQTVFPNETFK